MAPSQPPTFGHYGDASSSARKPNSNRSFTGTLVLLGIPLAIIGGLIGLIFQAERVNIDSGLAGTWPIPVRSDLETVSGVMDAPYSIHIQTKSADIDWDIGNLVADDGHVFSYSCEPGGDHLECLGPSGQLQGHRVTISYFSMPRWIYPAYTFIRRETNTPSQIDGNAAAIAMEVTDDDAGQTILSYDESVQRLTAYQAAHTPHLIPMIDAGLKLIGLPTKTPLVAVGRGQDGPETMALAAASSKKERRGIINIVGAIVGLLGLLMPITWASTALSGLRQGHLSVRGRAYSLQPVVIDRATKPQEFQAWIVSRGVMAMLACLVLVSFAVWTWTL
jgi:hypothetical protein